MELFKNPKSLMEVRYVGGFYMIPIELPGYVLKSAAAALVLTIAAHGKQMSDALNNVLEELLNAALDGF